MATILLVDDDRSIVALLAEVVEDTGHIALTAWNGYDALNVARQQHPDLIISDVMMPVMDGYALLESIRADPSLTTIPVILISALPMKESSDSALATAFIPKPFDFQVFVAFLQRLP